MKYADARCDLVLSPLSQPEGNDTEGVDRYLFDMIGQLREIAKGSNRELLAYFLGIAQTEAGDPNWRAVKTNCRAPASRPRFRSAPAEPADSPDADAASAGPESELVGP